MKIKRDVLISVCFVIPITIIYYLIYVLVDKIFNKWCGKIYCFEFPPYADILAIYTAIVGLYFVILSLDDWKKQDQYQTAKNNIEQLYTILNEINRFKDKLSNLDDYSLQTPFIFNPFSTTKKVEHTDAFLKFKEFQTQSKIEDLIEKAEKTILKKSINLEQNKFENLLSTIKPYTENIKKEIELVDKFIMNKYEQDLIMMQETLQNIKDNTNKMEDNNSLKKGYQLIIKLITESPNSTIAPQKSLFIFGDDFEIKYENIVCGDIEQNKILEILNKENHPLLNFITELDNLQNILNDFVS